MNKKKKHLAVFESLIRDYRVRPTVLIPIWHICGWLLGASTAALGSEAAMMCTVGVESVIGEHYNTQLRDMNERGMDTPQYKELREIIRTFRDDELEHHDIGLANTSNAPLYETLKVSIQLACKAAIWISIRI